MLPALINELIVLLKETAIIGYIGHYRYYKSGNSGTEPYLQCVVPLISAAVFYLVLVMLLTHFMGKLERRLRKSEH